MGNLALILCTSIYAYQTGAVSGASGNSCHPQMVLETDDLLDSYMYNQSEQMSTVGASYGEYATVDDFVLTGGSTTTFSSGYTCWGVTTSSTPTTLSFLIVEDSSGHPVGAPVSQESFPAECIDSGYSFAGYTIWCAHIELPAWLPIPDPSWIGSHRNDGMDWYPLEGTTIKNSEGYRTIGSWSWEPFSTSLVPGDLFKIFYGTSSSLDRCTWGEIKGSF